MISPYPYCLLYLCTVHTYRSTSITILDKQLLAVDKRFCMLCWSLSKTLIECYASYKFRKMAGVVNIPDKFITV